MGSASGFEILYQSLHTGDCSSGDLVAVFRQERFLHADGQKTAGGETGKGCSVL